MHPPSSFHSFSSASSQERVAQALEVLERIISHPGVLDELADLVARAAQRSASLLASSEASASEENPPAAASSSSSSSSASSSPLSSQRQYGPLRGVQDLLLPEEEPTLFCRPRLLNRSDSRYPIQLDFRISELLLKHNYLAFEKRQYKVSTVQADRQGQCKVTLERAGERRTSTLEKNLSDCAPSGFFTNRGSSNPVRKYRYALVQATTLEKGSYFLVKNITYERSESSWFASANLVSLAVAHKEPIELIEQPEKIRIYPQHHGILGLVRIPRKSDAHVLALMRRIFSILPNCLDQESAKIGGTQERAISTLRLG